jgi:6-phosphogluconolactonase
MDPQPKVTIYADRQQLAAGLSAQVAHLAATASKAKGRFFVAFSGGSLLDIIAPALSASPLRERIDWSTWHVFWTDERWVPWSSSDSNFGVAQRLLFDRIAIPGGQVYAADDSHSPAETAQAYESSMRIVFQNEFDEFPRFDLILLGVGEDGHTASLFPDHPVLSETLRWVVPVLDAPKPPPVRITMTLPVINHARNVIFAAAGPSKANVISILLNSRGGRPKLPAQLVNPSNGELRWFIDRAAGAAIHPPFTVEGLPAETGGN